MGARYHLSANAFHSSIVSTKNFDLFHHGPNPAGGIHPNPSRYLDRQLDPGILFRNIRRSQILFSAAGVSTSIIPCSAAPRLPATPNSQSIGLHRRVAACHRHKRGQRRHDLAPGRERRAAIAWIRSCRAALGRAQLPD
jgi:hypothetical protein